MRNAIILHGLTDSNEYYSDQYPSASNSHWLPWLQKHLMINDIKADTPQVFKLYDPNYNEFVKEVERFDITAETTLVGHSLGAGFWVRYLSDNPDKVVDKVFLVAPWINSDKIYDIDFFDFEIDPELINRVNKLIIFNSDNDSATVQDSVRVLTNQIPGIIVQDFHNYGHFNMESMKTDAFPELLDAIV